MMIFETERLLVRRYNESYKENFFALNGNADVMRYIRPTKTKQQCDEFLLEVIAYSQAEPLYGRWAVEDRVTKKFVGSFAIIPVEEKDQMQLGYALLPQHWCKGYATELTFAGVEYVFTNTPVDPLYAYTQPPNLPSQNVLLKAGFKQNGSYKEGGKEVTEFVFYKEEFLKPQV